MTLEEIDSMVLTNARLKAERDAARVALAAAPFRDELKRAYSDAQKRYNNAMRRYRVACDQFEKLHTKRMF